MNYKLVLKLNGYILMFDAVFMIIPIICAVIYKESAGFAFLPAMAIMAVIGAALAFLLKPKNKDLYARDGFATVAIAWIIMSFMGSLPFFFSKEIPNLIDCFFETTSGYTTTGATILTNVEKLSKCMLLWRSFTHWIGGMGVLVFMLAFTPLAGAHNIQLMRAESPGPKVEKLVPKTNATAKVLYGMYIFLTFLQFVLLLLAKMPVFDALATAFGTAGTGGFGIKNDSIASYSFACQTIVTVFMLLFAVNFNIYFLLIFRKFKAVWKNEELRMFVCVVALAIVLITANNFGLFDSLYTAFHHSAFTVASIVSTTGFATVDFNLWPEFSKFILFALMFMGGCAGSTGGGIKVSRILIMLKFLKKDLLSLIHPRSINTISMNGKKIEDETIKKINSYLICYIAILFFSIAITALDNFGFETTITAAVTTINNVGPGFAGVGPAENFSNFSYLSKIVLSFNMIFGRLEIFPLIILFMSHTWKKY